jgi:N-dimethylarginine dimethylaminohydrolase
MNVINQRVLMSDARFFSNEQPINPYYHEERIDVAKAAHEHAHIQTMFKDAGIEIISVNSPATSQDGVYTANWALVRGKKAVLARLPNARTSEEDWAEKILHAQGLDVIRVPDTWRFSGQGDALPCGNYLFCGNGYRSDLEAQNFAATALGYTRIQLQTVPQLDSKKNAVVNASSGWPDSFYYDIDLALAIIEGPSKTSHGTIAYCPEAFTPKSQQILTSLEGFKKIIVSEYEAKQAFACNLVSTGKSVIMSGHAPEMRKNIEALGLTVHSPEITELVKGGGYIRCTSLSFND